MIDPKTLASVTASTDTDLWAVTSGKRASVLGLTVTNYSGSDAVVKVMHTTSGNALQSYLFNNTVKSGDTVEVCSKNCLKTIPSTNKIRVNSAQANVSFQADGTED
jgi:hypothetical protein